MRTRDSIHRKNSPFYGPERFTYQPEHNRYICPAGQSLNYGGRNMRNRTYAYIGTRKRCGGCPLKAQCTSGAFRFLAIHMDEPARQRARELVNTPEAVSRRDQHRISKISQQRTTAQNAAPPRRFTRMASTRAEMPNTRAMNQRTRLSKLSALNLGERLALLQPTLTTVLPPSQRRSRLEHTCLLRWPYSQSTICSKVNCCKQAIALIDLQSDEANPRSQNEWGCGSHRQYA